jgi:hypothetical protein
MATIDQRERYRRQAMLCYEIAKTMEGERTESMVRLGDAYSALAESPGKFRPDLFTPNEKYADPACKKCGQRMKLTQSLPRTEIMPAMQAFRCDACGETLIWKGERSSSGQLAAGAERLQPAGTHYAAISFRQVEGKGFAPGQAIECADAETAILCAELMTRRKANIGSGAFSRREAPMSADMKRR